MPLAVTLLMSSGEPDPTWTLTPEQEQEFHAYLAAAPTPNDTVGPPSRRAGYGGIMVRDGSGGRMVVYRGWVRGGTLAHTDDKRRLEQWLLDTGAAVVPAKLLAELSKQITPNG